MSEPYVIQKAQSSYINSIDPSELLKWANECVIAYKKNIYFEYKFDLLELAYTSRMKAYFIKFLNGDLELNDDYSSSIENAQKIIERKNQDKMLYAASVASILMDNLDLFKRLNDSFNTFNASIDESIKEEYEDCNALRTKVNDWIERTKRAILDLRLENIFLEYKEQHVSFIRIEDVFSRLDEAIIHKGELILDKISKYENELELSFANAFFYEFDSKPYNLTYMPVVNVNSSSRILIFHSPFFREIELHAYSLFKDKGLSFKALDMHNLNNIKPDEVNRLFNIINKNKYNLFISNLEELNELAISSFYNELVNASNNGSIVIIGDYSCKNIIYNRFIDTIRSKGISFSLIEEVYLTMPDFGDVIDLFFKLGMIDNKLSKDAETLRCEMQLIGFFGMNQLIEDFKNKIDWVQNGRFISASNMNSRYFSYVRGLKDITKFIDRGWNEDTIYHRVGFVKREFDYSKVDGYDITNLKKIIECPKANAYDKVGMIIDYGLTHGNDGFSRLQAPSKLERIKATISALYLFYEIDLKCEVVMKDMIDDSISTLGRCCERGKRIELVNRLLNDYETLRETIAHETFHALQDNSSDTNYKPWLREIGVTKNRVSEWNYNNRLGEYTQASEKEDSYRVQVIEADAYAFQKDCFDGYKEVMGSIDFE